MTKLVVFHGYKSDTSGMGAKKQAKKQRGKQRKNAGNILSSKGKSSKKIEALKERNRSLQLQVARLQRQLDEASDGRRKSEHADALMKKGAIPRYKIDWTRYAYLHDRYEAYIEKGVKKEEARKMANRDLIGKFGSEAGYTDRQLKCIFL